MRKAKYKFMGVFILLVLVLTGTVRSYEVIIEKRQWKKEEGGNDHYYAIYKKSSWWNTNESEAAYVCGGWLGTITSPEEQSWVTQQFGERSYWIGAHREANCESWQWVTGEPFGYTNWMPNQGFRPLDEEAFVLINSSGSEWEDSTRANYFTGGRFLIEWDDLPIIISVTPKYTGLFHKNIEFINELDVLVEWNNDSPIYIPSYLGPYLDISAKWLYNPAASQFPPQYDGDDWDGVFHYYFNMGVFEDNIYSPDGTIENIFFDVELNEFAITAVRTQHNIESLQETYTPLVTIIPEMFYDVNCTHIVDYSSPPSWSITYTRKIQLEPETDEATGWLWGNKYNFIFDVDIDTFLEIESVINSSGYGESYLKNKNFAQITNNTEIVVNFIIWILEVIYKIPPLTYVSFFNMNYDAEFYEQFMFKPNRGIFCKDRFFSMTTARNWLSMELTLKVSMFLEDIIPDNLSETKQRVLKAIIDRFSSFKVCAGLNTRNMYVKRWEDQGIESGLVCVSHKSIGEVEYKREAKFVFNECIYTLAEKRVGVALVYDFINKDLEIIPKYNIDFFNYNIFNMDFSLIHTPDNTNSETSLNGSDYSTEYTSGFLNRCYINFNNYMLLSNNTSDSTGIVENIYPTDSPSISESDNDIFILTTYDDPNKPITQSTELKCFYSNANNYSWTDLSVIEDNNNSEYFPSIIHDSNGNLLAVWMRIRSNDFISDDLDEMLGEFDIFYSVYDELSLTWSSPVNLTNNTYFDMPPKLHKAQNGDVLLTWRSNLQNFIFDNDGDLPDSAFKYHSMLWDGNVWSEEKTILSGIPYINEFSVAYSDNEGIFVYSLDSGWDSEGDNDSELYYVLFNGDSWGTPVQFSNDTVQDRNPRVLYNTDGSKELFWLKDNNLVRLTDWDNESYQLILSDFAKLNTVNYKLIMDNNDNIAIIYQDYAEGKPDIFYTYYYRNDDLWSLPQCLTNDNEGEISIDATFDSNNDIIMVYNKKGFRTDDPSVQQTDLCFVKQQIGYDLAIDSMIFSDSNSEFGTAITTNIVVKNSGPLKVTSFELAIYNGDPDNGGILIGNYVVDNDGLIGGDSKEITINWSVPVSSQALNIYAYVDPDNDIDEINETNNYLSERILYPDLIINSAYYNLNNEGIIDINVSVENKGKLSASDVTLVLKNKTDQDKILYEGMLSVIDNDSIAPVSYSWDTSGIYFSEEVQLIEIVADVDDSILESDNTNNSYKICVVIFDQDHDHLPNWWEDKYELPKDNDGNVDEDTDNDGLTCLQEYLNKTNPNKNDSDNDGIPDGWEVNNNLNPLDNDSLLDFDNDGLINVDEYNYKTRPDQSDTDNDGLTDYEEVYSNFNISPILPDSDNDGMNDGDELKAGMEPDNGSSIFKIIDLNLNSDPNQVKVIWNRSTSNGDIEYKVFWSDNITDWNEVQFNPADIIDNDGKKTWIDEGDNDSVPVRSLPTDTNSRYYKVIVE